jgi:non-specific serine/threonine protein kinase
MISDGRMSTAGKPGGFLGRERELGELRRLCRQARAVAMSGPGGIGKTRLLRALADDLDPDYPGGTVLIGLGGLRQPDFLAARLASALGVAQELPGPLPAGNRAVMII